MNKTIEEFERAGKLSTGWSWDNDELKLIIEATELTLSFLSGKGEK